MARSILVFLCCIRFYALGLSTILYGPGYPNRFACINDVYGVALNGFKMPDALYSKIANASSNVSRVVETPQETELERELTQSTLRLFQESHKLKTGLVYPEMLVDLQMYIARDYVAAHSALASLNTLKVLHYIHSTLNAFAKDNVQYSSRSKGTNAQFLVCSAIVYVKVAEKMAQQKTRHLQKIREESKRISYNISTLGRVKTTGDISLFKSGFGINNTFIGMAIVVIGTLLVV